MGHLPMLIFLQKVYNFQLKTIANSNFCAFSSVIMDNGITSQKELQEHFGVFSETQEEPENHENLQVSSDRRNDLAHADTIDGYKEQSSIAG